MQMLKCENLSCRFYDGCPHAVDGHEEEDGCEGVIGACAPCRPFKRPIKASIVQYWDGLALVVKRDRRRGTSRSVSTMSFLSEDELKEVEIAINRYFANKK